MQTRRGEAILICIDTLAWFVYLSKQMNISQRAQLQ